MPPETEVITCPACRHLLRVPAEWLGQTVQSIVEELNPEAAYFTDMDGTRGGYLVINMDEASQIPAVAEPLFLGLGATIELHAVMTPEKLSPGPLDPGPAPT